MAKAVESACPATERVCNFPISSGHRLQARNLRKFNPNRLPLAPTRLHLRNAPSLNLRNNNRSNRLHNNQEVEDGEVDGAEVGGVEVVGVNRNNKR